MSDRIETGTGEGFTLTVNSAGQAQTQAEVTNTVTTRKVACDAVASSVVVGTTSGQLLGQRPGRRGLLIQNGAATVHLNFSGDVATAADWKVAAGGEFKAEDFPVEGEVNAIAMGASSTVLAIELVEP